jgi:hypothetical protein
VVGQKRMQVKYEFGLTIDKFSLVNPQNNVGIFNNKQGVAGFTLSHLIVNNLYFETGYYDKFYAADLYSVVPDTTNLVVALNRIQIPLRLLYKKPLFTKKLSFSLVTGISLMIANSFNGLAYSPIDNSWSTEGKKANSIFNVFEIGVGTEYEILKNFTLGLNYRTFLGSKNIFHYRIKKVQTDNSITNYDLKSKGNFDYVSFSLGYKF